MAIIVCVLSLFKTHSIKAIIRILFHGDIVYLFASLVIPKKIDT